MTPRFLVCALSLGLFFAGCAQQQPPTWFRPLGTVQQRDRDLAAAREEAAKAYPEVKPFLAKAKSPEKAELMLADMRNEVVKLYMASRGWQLVTIDSRGHLHAAH
jgi:hypothetical protein